MEKLSKLSYFTVWCHTWWKNWINCAVLTGNSTGLRTVLFQSSFTHRTAQFTQGIPQFPQFTCPHHDGFISRYIRFYQFIQQMNIARYIPFQISLLTPHFTSSFRIALWPVWLANSERQPCFYPPQSHAQEDTQNWQENWQTWRETCAVSENIQFSFFVKVFF